MSEQFFFYLFGYDRTYFNFYKLSVLGITSVTQKFSVGSSSGGAATPGIGAYPGGVGSSSNATGLPALWFLIAS